MKNLVVLILILLATSAFAQNGSFNASQVGQTFRGFLIDDKHDTVRGSFKFEKLHYMQMSPAVVADNKALLNKNFNYKFAISFELENKTEWFSTQYTILKPPADPKRLSPDCYLLVEEAGPITLFQYNFYDDSSTPKRDEIKTYMQLPDGKVIDLSSLILGFKNKMSEYVKDDVELAKKIVDKEQGYGMLGINKIVREYNEWYMSKNAGFTIFKK
jgi:hypothetical protein